MYAVPVDASLKTPEGALLENGKAYISEWGDYIDFKNDFVPLLKLGDKVVLCLILNDAEVVRFEGTAYISSNNLLRISQIDRELANTAKEMFGSNLFVHTIIQFAKQNRFKTIKTRNNVAATIYSISKDTLRFISLEKVEIGQRIFVDFTEPFKFSGVEAIVEKKWQLGVMATGYQCYISYMPDSAKDSVEKYLSPFRTQIEDLHRLYGRKY